MRHVSPFTREPVIKDKEGTQRTPQCRGNPGKGEKEGSKAGLADCKTAALKFWLNQWKSLSQSQESEKFLQPCKEEPALVPAPYSVIGESSSWEGWPWE